MALNKRLLEKLVCPKCKGALVYSERENTLTCHGCRLVYPIQNDIPVLLVDEANKLQ